MFIVTKEGRAGISTIAGVFTDRAKAEAGVMAAINQEADTYHTFDLYWIPVNEMTLHWSSNKISERESNPNNKWILLASYEPTDRIHDSVSVDYETHKHDETKTKPRNLIEEFAYAVLSGDTSAIDMVKDVLKQ